VPRFLFLTAGLIAFSPTVRADEAIAPETVELVKKATVYIRIETDTWISSGTGFVISSDEKNVLIATNHHVALPTPPAGSRPAPTGKTSPITVVFDSGMKTQQSYTGTVVAADAEKDLAVVRVGRTKNLVRPIPYEEPVKLVETMQVYTFGFPFGELLASDKGFPTITIGKASVSSFRNGPDGELARVQIDGNLNPGNSGGPVVDSKGRLVGIAKSILRDGQGIGFAIPASDLTRLLQGRLGRVKVTSKKQTDSLATVRIEVDLIDPMESLRAATAYYLVVPPKTKRPEIEALDKHPGSKKLALNIEKSVGTAEFSLPTGEGEVMIQVMAEPAGKAVIANRVRAYSLAAVPKIYLSDLKEYAFVSGPPGWSFGKNGDLGNPEHAAIQVNGNQFTKGLGMHPPNPGKYTQISYNLSENAKEFRGSVALDDTVGGASASPVFFEVLGDKTSLWKSKPIQKSGLVEDFEIDVSGVKLLQLRVHAQGRSNFRCAGVWLDPYLADADSLFPDPKPKAAENPKVAGSPKIAEREKVPENPRIEGKGIVYLSDLKESDFVPGPGWGWGFGKNGDLGNMEHTPIQLNGTKYTKGLGMHPPDLGKYTQISYTLTEKAKKLKGSAGVDDSSLGASSPILFEVWGDKKSLWKSKPIQKKTDVEAFEINVTGIKALQLRVSLDGGSHRGCHAVWLDPYIVEE
jgi:hypothetical protein